MGGWEDKGAYECPRDGLSFVHHGFASIEHGADLAVIAGSFDGVLADHVDHLLVAFYQGDMMFEYLLLELA